MGWQNDVIGLCSQLMRFGLVGVLATISHVGIAYGALQWGEFNPQLANIIGFFCAVGVSFFGHWRFTFQKNAMPWFYLRRFLVLAGLNWVISSLCVYIAPLSFGISDAQAILALTIVMPAFSFLVMRFFVFKLS